LPEFFDESHFQNGEILISRECDLLVLPRANGRAYFSN
jgi:hypothetical protein